MRNLTKLQNDCSILIRNTRYPYLIYGVYLFEVEVWKISKLDFLPLLVTFIGCLVDTSDGILIGIATHLVILLYHYADPTIEDYEENGIVKIEIKSNLYFPR